RRLHTRPLRASPVPAERNGCTHPVSALLVAQCDDGVEPRSATCRPDPEEHADRAREPECQEHRGGSYGDAPGQHPLRHARRPDAERDAERTTRETQDERLDEELEHDVATARTERLAHADLACPFG